MREAWRVTREVARALSTLVIVFRCPASFTFSKENVANLKKFSIDLDRDGFLFAWEPRGEWRDRVMLKLCRDLALIHCVGPFQRLPVTKGLAYFRLHGIGGYNHHYSSNDLQRLHGWCHNHGEAYSLFDNVSMYQDAQKFQEVMDNGN